MRCRSTPRRRCRCSGWPRGPTGTSWPTSAAPGRRRSTLRAPRSPTTATPPPARARWRTAMRADLFDIDCDFYLAGPRGLRADAARRAARRRRAGGADRTRRCCDERCPRASCACAPARHDAALAAAAAASRSRCACSATAWRPSSTTARSSSSSPTARCATAASCWPSVDGEWIFRQLRRDGDGWALHALNPARAPRRLPLPDLAAVRGVVIQKARARAAARLSKRYV